MDYEIAVIIRDLKLDPRKIKIKFGNTGQDYGWCDYICGFAHITVNKRLPREEKLVTLQHELRHAYQYMTGILKNYKVNKVQWKGITYTFVDSPVYRPGKEKEFNEQLRAYKAQPWEKDARRYEKKKLFKREYVGAVGKVKLYKLC
jgi:hypothetical protein